MQWIYSFWMGEKVLKSPNLDLSLRKLIKIITKIVTVCVVSFYIQEWLSMERKERRSFSNRFLFCRTTNFQDVKGGMRTWFVIKIPSNQRGRLLQINNSLVKVSSLDTIASLMMSRWCTFVYYLLRLSSYVCVRVL